MFMHTYNSFPSFWYYFWLVHFCLSFSLSLSLSLFLLNSLRMAPKCKCAPSRNPLRSGASSSSDPTPCHVRFRDDKARQDFSKNFSKCSIHSKCQVSFRISPILIYPLSLTVRVRNPFMIYWSIVPLWSYKSFTPICTDLIIPYLFFLLLFEIYVL